MICRLACNFTPPNGFIPVDANVERGWRPPLYFLHHRRKAGGIAHPLRFTMHHLGIPRAAASLRVTGRVGVFDVFALTVHESLPDGGSTSSGDISSRASMELSITSRAASICKSTGSISAIRADGVSPGDLRGR